MLLNPLFIRDLDLWLYFDDNDMDLFVLVFILSFINSFLNLSSLSIILINLCLNSLLLFYKMLYRSFYVVMVDCKRFIYWRSVIKSDVWLGEINWDVNDDLVLFSDDDYLDLDRLLFYL